MITECGAPNVIKSDNAPEFKGKQWRSQLDKLCIQSKFTEAHHPNENLAERRGGALKAATVHLLVNNDGSSPGVLVLCSRVYVPSTDSDRTSEFGLVDAS